jgi:hypothetical protein
VKKISLYLADFLNSGEKFIVNFSTIHFRKESHKSKFLNMPHIKFGIRLFRFLLMLYFLLFLPIIIIKNIMIGKNRPQSGECLPSLAIDALIAPDRAADMQANLTETFPLWVERHGLAAAHRIRKVQIARLIIGEYGNKVLELIKAVKLAGS